MRAHAYGLVLRKSPCSSPYSAERAVVELEKRERAAVKAAAKAAGKADTAQYEEDMRLQRDAAREIAANERAEWSAMRADRVERHLSDLEAASAGWVGVDSVAIEAAIDEGEYSFIYRYIPRESCSQFDSLPLTYLTIPDRCSAG